MGTTPHKAVGVESLTTIHRARVLTSDGMILTMYTEDKHERVNTREPQRLQFKMVDI